MLVGWVGTSKTVVKPRKTYVCLLFGVEVTCASFLARNIGDLLLRKPIEKNFQMKIVNLEG